MSIDDNANYYAGRAEQARTLAEHAESPQVRTIHLHMAERYAQLAQGDGADRPKLSIVAGRA